MKTAYIIPGFGEIPKEKKYKRISEIFEKNGFDVKTVGIKWHRRTMEDYVSQLMEQYDSPKDEATVLGFSLGANIALLAARKFRPKNLILCSLSPFFREDETEFKTLGWEWYMKPYSLLTDFLVSPALKSMKNYSFRKVSDGIKSRVFILAGKEELPEVLRRSEDAHKIIDRSRILLVENSGHDIGNENYIRELEKIISKLS